MDSLAAFSVMAANLGFIYPIKVKNRAFVCVACGVKIPPGKPGRRCKYCRDHDIVLDESSPLKKYTVTGRTIRSTI